MRFIPLHPIRSASKVDNLVHNFDAERAEPILVGDYGQLLNGTHRYQAYQRRYLKKEAENFTFVYVEDLTGWVADALEEHLQLAIESDADGNFVDIDAFWGENWHFAEYKSKGHDHEYDQTESNA